MAVYTAEWARCQTLLERHEDPAVAQAARDLEAEFRRILEDRNRWIMRLQREAESFRLSTEGGQAQVKEDE